LINNQDKFVFEMFLLILLLIHHPVIVKIVS
jgi:hypothetical protein